MVFTVNLYTAKYGYVEFALKHFIYLHWLLFFNGRISNVIQFSGLFCVWYEVYHTFNNNKKKCFYASLKVILNKIKQ